MQICKEQDVLKEPLRSKIKNMILVGRIFIYPTDTVYGLGCNALIEESVKKIRDIKKSRQPFSVIAPSKEWIEENLYVMRKEYMDKLPGPYTLVLLKKSPILDWVSADNTLGVRIPLHPIADLIEEAGVPFITTSANLSGENPIRSLNEIPEEMKKAVDIAVDGGRLVGRPSRVIDVTGEKTRILRK